MGIPLSNPLMDDDKGLISSVIPCLDLNNSHRRTTL